MSKPDLSNIPKQDLPQYLKKHHPEIYLNLAWQKVNEWRDNQKNQAAMLGDTPDYDRQLFTLDQRASRMVSLAFKKYWHDGLIYKNAYLVNWSVGLQTALSDVAGEIEYEKRVDPFVTFEYRYSGFLYSPGLDDVREDLKKLIYKTTDFFEKNPIKVSTVRPETIFGDVAVAIHPNVLQKKLAENLESQENMYGFTIEDIKTILALIQTKDLKIFFQVFPLQNLGVELILATEVEEDFGTGALKITPASDMADYEIWQKYLTGDFPRAVGRDGKLTEVCGEFAGLSVEKARVMVIKKLLETGYIQAKKDSEIQEFDLAEFEKLNYQKACEYLKKLYPEAEIDWNYEHNVTICERSKTVIEPLISEEFFLSYHKTAKSTGKSLQQHGLEGIEEIQFFSEDYKDRAKNFLENIKDWCISRDLVWGHQIPVWYNLDVNPEKRLYSWEEIQKIQKAENGKQKIASNNIENLFLFKGKKVNQNLVDIVSKARKYQITGAITFVFNQQNQVLVLKRKKDVKNRPNEFELPGGKVEWEKGDLVENAKRELFEETNININSQNFTFLDSDIFNFKQTEIFNTFFAVKLDFSAEIKLGHEHDEYFWLEKEEAMQKIGYQKSKEILTGLEIQKAKRKKLTEEGNLPIYIGDEKPDLPGNWVKETKIFDTWFSSGLWPLTTLDFYDYLAQREDLVIIGGGESFETDEEFLEFLENWRLSPQDYLDIETESKSWKKDLQKELKDYNIRVAYPQMPNKLNAKYEEWKAWFEKVLFDLENSRVEEEVVLSDSDISRLENILNNCE